MFKNELQVRLFALALFLSVEYTSAVALDYVPANDCYFAVCALFNFGNLLILTACESRPVLLSLSKLTFIQLLIQFFGWIYYSLSFHPVLYNVCIHIIVLITLIRIFWIDKNDTDTADNPYRSLFHSADCFWQSKVIGAFK